jgi:N-dimethylarginine dimethylaminohydrolase
VESQQPSPGAVAAQRTAGYAFNSHGVLRRVMLCRPDFYSIHNTGEFALLAMERGDAVVPQRAQEMHAEFASALRDADVEIVYEEPEQSLPNQIYTRDHGVMTPAGALVGILKYDVRKGEREAALRAYSELGITLAGEVSVGALEGGDTWQIDERTLVIGAGNRSTLRGIEDAARIMRAHGVDVLPVEFPARWNHLDQIFAIVAEKLCLCCLEAVPHWFQSWLRVHGWKIIPVSEEETLKTGANVEPLGNDRVLSFAENELVNEAMKAEGVTVYEPHLREFTKMGGGPHCLTMELEREP